MNPIPSFFLSRTSRGRARRRVRRGLVEGRLRPPHPPDVVQYLAGRSREDIVEGGYGSSPEPASRRGECRTFGQQVAYSVLGTALPAEWVRGEVQAMESGPRQGLPSLALQAL